MGKPLLDVLRDMMLDPDEQAAFAHDPPRYLAQYGYEGVAADDLDEAFSLVADTLPPDVAQTVASTNPVAAPADPDDGRGGAPDTTINPDEDAFGGVDEAFDTMALNGAAGDATGGLGTDAHAGHDDGTGDGDGGYGSGELALGDIHAGDLGTGDVAAGDAVAFGVGSEAPGGPGAGADTSHLAGDGGGAPFLEHSSADLGLGLGLEDGLDQIDQEGGTAFVDHADDTSSLHDLNVLEGHVDSGDATADGDDVTDVDGPSGDATYDDIGSF